MNLNKKLLTFTAIMAVLSIATVGIVADDDLTDESEAANVTTTWHAIAWGTATFNILTGDVVTITSSSVGDVMTMKSYPSGASWNASTRAFSWTPSAAGTYTIVYDWTDPDYGTWEMVVTFNVVAQSYNFTLAYNAQGGSPTPPSQTGTSVNGYYSFTIPSAYRVGGTSAPERTNYTFLGWSTSASGSVIGSPYSVTVQPGTSTLYAQWSYDPVYTFVYNFDLNGGSGNTFNGGSFTNTSYTRNFQIINIAPTHSDLVFTHWEASRSTSLNGTYTFVGNYDKGATISFSTGSSSTYTIYYKFTAQYSTPGPYTISFDTNGGTGEIQSQSVMPGVNIQLPMSGFTRDGFYLAGWHENNPTGTTRSLGATWSPTDSDVVFYAKWEALPSGVYFDTRAPTVATVGSSYSYSPNMSDQSIPYGIYRELYMNNYRIAMVTSPDGMIVNQTSYTLSFSWTPSTPGAYLIHFFMDGSSSSLEAASAVYWIVKVYPTGHTTDMYTIQYESEHGTGFIPSQGPYLPNNAITIESNTFTRDGYTQAGWLTTVNGVSNVMFFLGSYYTITGNTVFTPYWVANSNIVVLNANGGVGSIDPYIAPTDGQVTLPSSGFTRDGYTLQGWYLADDPNTIYPKGYIYTISTSTTFYAYWVASGTSVLAVTINANGGTGGYTQNVESGKNIILPEYGINKSGSTLIGWGNSSGATTAAYDKGERVTITAAKTFYAVWGDASNYVTVSFNLNEGSGAIPAQTILSGGTATKPADPVRHAHIFTGWQISGGGAWSDWSTPITSDITLVAQWNLHFSVTVVEGTEVKLTVSNLYAGSTSINWGDGNTETIYGNQVTHDYGQSWIGSISVTSTVSGIAFNSTLPFSVDDGQGGGNGGNGDGGDNGDDEDDNDSFNWLFWLVVVIVILVSLLLLWLFWPGLFVWLPVGLILAWWVF